MPLAAGTRIGPYEVVAMLGAGGMGEVYRAHDTKLRRDVALKVLPGSPASDPDRLARFEREARLLAAINHPHIATMHGLEEADGICALVMELVEGTSLADLVARGPLSTLETRTIARQITEALEAAHDKGIIHRDLKPGNIMVRLGGPSGDLAVKVLDFGLAKAFVGDSAGADLSQAPTVTAAGTREGLILGTAAYMSPEQTRGQPLDRRTDIWAFGCVLFEMLTGRLAFPGKTISDTIAAILEREPDWRALPATTPAYLGWLLRRCLEKDSRRRLRDIGEARVGLTGSPDVEVEPAPEQRARVRPKPRSWAIAVGITVVVGAAIWVGWMLGRNAFLSSPGSAVGFSVAPPPGTAFGASLGSAGGGVNVETTSLALSPDGSQLAFVTSQPSAPSRIWVRSISAVDAKPVFGTEGALSVFWSPDSRSIAFPAGGKLKRLDLAGGTPVILCDVPERGLYGTWGDGAILFSHPGVGIFRVSTAGGAPVKEIEPNPTAGETTAGWPWFLPDGRRYVYTVRLRDREGRVKLAEPGKPTVTILSAISNVQWVDPDYLVFAREGTLVGQRFDLASGRVVGELFPIADRVQYSRSTSRATFSTSRTGALAYQSHPDLAQLMWFDRSGRPLPSPEAQGDYLSLRISPDGHRALVTRAEPRLGTYDMWAIDLDRSFEERLTSEPTSEIAAIWHPNGKAAIYSAERGGPPHLFYRDLETGTEKELLPAGKLQMAIDITPDGRLLAFWSDSALSTLPLGGSGAPSRLLVPKVNERSWRLSPDGKFVTLTSDESGSEEVYVAPFPAMSPRTRISIGGGSLPRWRQDGHELFYLSKNGSLMAVPVRTVLSLQSGAPVPLFTATAKWPWRDFDVSPDGQRFLAVVPQRMANEQPLTVILNWTATVTR